MGKGICRPEAGAGFRRQCAGCRFQRVRDHYVRGAEGFRGGVLEGRRVRVESLYQNLRMDHIRISLHERPFARPWCGQNAARRGGDASGTRVGIPCAPPGNSLGRDGRISRGNSAADKDRTGTRGDDYNIHGIRCRSVLRTQRGGSVGRHRHSKISVPRLHE